MIGWQVSDDKWTWTNFHALSGIQTHGLRFQGQAYTHEVDLQYTAEFTNDSRVWFKKHVAPFL
jgi:hypothetical protein